MDGGGGSEGAAQTSGGCEAQLGFGTAIGFSVYKHTSASGCVFQPPQGTAPRVALNENGREFPRPRSYLRGSGGEGVPSVTINGEQVHPSLGRIVGSKDPQWIFFTHEMNLNNGVAIRDKKTQQLLSVVSAKRVASPGMNPKASMGGKAIVVNDGDDLEFVTFSMAL